MMKLPMAFLHPPLAGNRTVLTCAFCPAGSYSNTTGVLPCVCMQAEHISTSLVDSQLFGRLVPIPYAGSLPLFQKMIKLVRVCV
jgi:hypothetical protein